MTRPALRIDRHGIDSLEVATIITTRAEAAGQPLTRAQSRGPAMVLVALLALTNPRTGRAVATAPGLAGSAAYTERWVRNCLTQLEALDIIEWERGGIINGKPAPSRFKVPGRVLAQVVRTLPHSGPRGRADTRRRPPNRRPTR